MPRASTRTTISSLLPCVSNPYMKMHSLMSVRILVFGLLSLVIPLTSSISFNLTDFTNCNTVSKYIKYQNDSSCKSPGVISLTADNVAVNDNSTGKATYNQPIPLWNKNTGEVTNFTTKFSFIIQNISMPPFADGFAFFLAPYPEQIRQNGYVAGRFLNLFEENTSLNPSLNPIVAVEFDTFNNPGIDPEGIGCHVGIDINNIKSTSFLAMDLNRNKIKDTNSCFFVNSNMTAQIEYNSALQLLRLLLWMDDDPKTIYNLNTTVDFTNVLPEKSTIGFSAATGGHIERNHIFSWSFESTLKVKPSNKASIIGGICAGVFLILILIGFLIYCFKRKRLIRYTKETVLIDFEFEKEKGPKRFTYSELVDATNGFAKTNKLGEGGFGSVFRGSLKNENIHVAVKRVSKESKQGKKEYISEVKIISQLRHKNLVQLVGWCHDHGEFLLVYELMHNGSLDTHLYSNESLLTWPIRQSIALGLGHALLYLHEECERCVVHRDIKPSNVMLDSSFNAKLGDFGLARLTDHHQDLQTTDIMGTRGYMAPEYVLGRENASTQSDVYSFGVVLLELVCGRRPVEHQQDPEKVILVEWVWDLYGQNVLMEAVDGRLSGNFEREEVECFMIVGLWCAYPEKSLRPSIKQAMSVLQFQARLPILPPKMPQPVYAAPIYPDMELSTSSEATSSGVAPTSAKSAPIQSSDSSWLLKQQANTM